MSEYNKACRAKLVWLISSAETLEWPYSAKFGAFLESFGQNLSTLLVKRNIK